MGLYAIFVDGLPNGLASYPQCMGRASLLVNAIEHYGMAPLAEEVAPSVRAILQRPPKVSDWIREAELNAALMALADAHHVAPDELDGWIAVLARRLYAQLPYRLLMLVISPSVIVRGAESRWAAFHRGSSLRVIEHRTGDSTLVFRRPRPLLSGAMSGAVCAAIRVALEEAGAVEAQVVITDDGEEEAMIRCVWR